MAKQKIHIKICGMKFSENIQEASQLPLDFMGFIFYDKSPRNFEGSIPKISPEIKKIGVFVNASFEEIQEKFKRYHLDFIQLHGDETPEFCTLIENTGSKVIKAFAVDNHFDFSLLESYKNACTYFLFDTKGKHVGGNGIPFDWDILKNYTARKEYFLSGGIGLEDNQKLSDFFKKEYSKKCFAIDVNSRFESSPGLKDISKLKEFTQQLTEKQ